MSDPFRYYEGVPVLDLAADPPAPEMPAFDVLQGTSWYSKKSTLSSESKPEVSIHPAA